MRKTALILLIVGGCLSIALQLWTKTAPQTRKLPEDLINILLPQPRSLQPFQLIDHHGKPFTMERLRNRWTFIFFGYTQCPDICPVAMGLLAEVAQQLKQLGNQTTTQTLFVSVDPQRDSPALLKQYIPYFNPAFVGITGKADNIKQFSRQVGAFYMIPKDADPKGTYAVSHTGAIFLIDPQARFSAIFSHQYQEGLRIAKLFGKITNHYDKEQQE